VVRILSNARGLAALIALAAVGCSSGNFTSAVWFETAEPLEADALVKAIDTGQWDRAMDLVERISESEELFPLGGPITQPPLPMVCHSKSRPAAFQARGDGRAFLIRKLSCAPKELIESYRKRFDEKARQAVLRGITRQTWEQFFFSTGMGVEGNRLASRLLNDGLPMDAFEIWSELLMYDRDAPVPREVLAGRMLLAAAAAGEPDLIRSVPLPKGVIHADQRELTLSELKDEFLRTCSPADDLEVTFADRLVAALPGGWSFEDLCISVPRQAMLFCESTRLPLFTADAMLGSICFCTSRQEAHMNLDSPSLGNFLIPGRSLPFAFAVRGGRLLWACSCASGVVDLVGKRRLWIGPLDQAPVPERWRVAVRGLLEERDPVGESQVIWTLRIR